MGHRDGNLILTRRDLKVRGLEMALFLNEGRWFCGRKLDFPMAGEGTFSKNSVESHPRGLLGKMKGQPKRDDLEKPGGMKQ